MKGPKSAMWYPNTAQWRVIWAVAVIIGVLGLMSLAADGVGFFLFALFFDAGVLIWWLQRHGPA